MRTGKTALQYTWTIVFNGERTTKKFVPLLWLLTTTAQVRFGICSRQQKGVDTVALKWCLEKLDDAGYRGGRIAIKTDQESHITALTDAIAASRDGHTVFLETKVRMSKENGAAEMAVVSFSAQVRALKSYFDLKCGKVIPDNHAILAWATTWAGEPLTRYHVGRKGIKVFENITGIPRRYAVVPLGEEMMCKRSLPKGGREQDQHSMG